MTCHCSDPHSPRRDRLVNAFRRDVLHALPPPRLDLIMFPHCMADTDISRQKADSLVWLPSSKLSGFRDLMKHNLFNHELVQVVKPFSVFLTALRAGPPLLGWYTSGGPPRGRSLLKDRDVRTYAKKIPFDFHFRPIRIYGICACSVFR